MLLYKKKKKKEVETNYKFHRNDHVLEELAEEVCEAIINIDFKF